MNGIVGTLVDTSDFPARWHCGNWTDFHGWVHIIADIAIFGAYTAIPMVLVYFLLKKGDISFPAIGWLFSIFILACGTSHLVEAGIFWWPAYRVAGTMKVITACVSWLTVIALIRIAPKAMELPGLATLNASLQAEVQRRAAVELELITHREELQDQVNLRTQELQTANAALEKEIVETRRIQRELIAQDRVLRSFADHTPAAVAMFNTDMDYLLCTNRWRHDYRIADVEVIGQNHYDVFPELSDDWKAIHQRCLTGAVESKELDSFIRVSGEIEWLRWEIHPWYDGSDQVGGIIMFTEVITRQIEAKQTLEKHARELESSNQALRDFAYIASHDLQEPLRKIRTFGSRLIESAGDQLDERSEDYLSRITSAAERMQSMIDGLLDYSRVTMRQDAFKRVDLNEVVREVLETLEVRIQQHDALIDVPPLPTIDADPIQMVQLFQNLIGNALKFVRPDNRPQIGVRSRDTTSGEIEISVSDNGIGIDPDHVSRLFQPFTRLNPRTAFEGSGIGLSICRKIVERHHGQIEIRGALGEGTTFVITFPHTLAVAGQATPASGTSD